MRRLAFRGGQDRVVRIAECVRSCRPCRRNAAERAGSPVCNPCRRGATAALWRTADVLTTSAAGLDTEARAAGCCGGARRRRMSPGRGCRAGTRISQYWCRWLARITPAANSESLFRIARTQGPPAANLRVAQPPTESLRPRPSGPGHSAGHTVAAK